MRFAIPLFLILLTSACGSVRFPLITEDEFLKRCENKEDIDFTRYIVIFKDYPNAQSLTSLKDEFNKHRWKSFKDNTFSATNSNPEFIFQEAILLMNRKKYKAAYTRFNMLRSTAFQCQAEILALDCYVKLDIKEETTSESYKAVSDCNANPSYQCLAHQRHLFYSYGF